MGIKVEDIRNVDFPVDKRGYNCDEVDDFLDAVAAQTEELAKANLELTKELEAAKQELTNQKNIAAALEQELKKASEEKLAAVDAARKAAEEAAAAAAEEEPASPFNEPSYFKNLETTLRETLISAQRIADDTISGAQKQADDIIAEAKAKAEAIEKESADKLAGVNAEYERVKGAGEEYSRSFKALIDEQAKLLKDSPLFIG